MRLRQRHCIWRSFTDCPSTDILLLYPEERDDKKELIKAGHYVLLRRATLSQPENEKVYPWVSMLLFAQKQLIDWFVCE